MCVSGIFECGQRTKNRKKRVSAYEYILSLDERRTARKSGNSLLKTALCVFTPEKDISFRVYFIFRRDYFEAKTAQQPYKADSLRYAERPRLRKYAFNTCQGGRIFEL